MNAGLQDKPATRRQYSSHMSSWPMLDGTCTASSWLQAIVDGPLRPLKQIGGHTGRYGYFSVAGSYRMLALEAPGGLELPIGITVSEHIINDALQSRSATIGCGRLVTRSGFTRVTANRDDQLRLEITCEQAKIAARKMAHELNSVGRPDEPQMVHDAVATFEAVLFDDPSTRLENAVHSLIGLGFGSTPSGDDVISGAAATLSAISQSSGDLSTKCCRIVDVLRKVIRHSHTKTTSLSVELMSCAVHGYAPQCLRRYVNFALNDGDISEATSKLCAVGHNSGYFLATGATLALRAISKQHKQEAFHA